MKKNLGFVTLLLLITLIACKSLQNEGGTDWATVEFSIDGSRQSNALYSSSGSSIRTALIIAVSVDVTSVETTNYLVSHYDLQLQDLTNNTVSLKVPLNTSFHLVKVVFKENLTLDNIVNNQPTAFCTGISEAFSVNSSSESKTIAITMDTNLYSKDIVSFSFNADVNSALTSDITATIDGTSITLTVPFDAFVTSLVATFATTGQTVTVGDTLQASGSSVNDFTNDVTYTVTAADGSTQDYAVTVSIAAGVVGETVNYTVGSVSFTMVYISGGITFPKGLSDSSTGTVSNSYLIAQTEVTYELWSAVYTWAVSNGYTFANSGTKGNDGNQTIQDPVTTINWRDALVWTNALTEYYNAQKGLSLTCAYHSNADYTAPIRDSSDGSYSASTNPTVGGFDDPYVKSDATGFRLLTIDEWELAARYIKNSNNDGDILDANEYYPGNFASGADDVYNLSAASDYDGDGDTEYTASVAVYSGNSGSATAAVKSKSPNALGLYDMNGNVCEWTYDSYNTPHSGPMGYDWNRANFLMQLAWTATFQPYNESGQDGLRIARGK